MADEETERDDAKVIAETLQEMDVEGLPGSGFMLGFICVVECARSDGSRWLMRISGDAQGDLIPSWQQKGYLHETLFCPEGWSDMDDDDEAEELD